MSEWTVEQRSSDEDTKCPDTLEFTRAHMRHTFALSFNVITDLLAYSVQFSFFCLSFLLALHLPSASPIVHLFLLLSFQFTHTYYHCVYFWIIYMGVLQSPRWSRPSHPGKTHAFSEHSVYYFLHCIFFLDCTAFFFSNFGFIYILQTKLVFFFVCRQ